MWLFFGIILQSILNIEYLSIYYVGLCRDRQQFYGRQVHAKSVARGRSLIIKKMAYFEMWGPQQFCVSIACINIFSRAY